MRAEHSVEGLAIYQGNKIVFANPTLCTMLGYAAEEIYTLEDPGKILRFEDHTILLFKEIERPLDEAATPLRCDVRGLHKNGWEFWLEAIAAATIYQGKPAVQLAPIVLSERKRAEHALRESDERFRIISELMSGYAFLYRVDPDGTWTMEWVIGSPIQIIGYDAAELNHTVRPYHPDDDERASQDVERTLQGQPTEGDYRVISKDGQVRWVNVRRQAMWDSQGTRITGFYAAVQDITERRQAEEQRLELALERQRVDLLRAFISDLSHDLKTPLSTINASIYLLERLTDPEQLKQKISIIKAQASHLEKLVQNILTLSQLDRTSALTLKPLHLNSLISDLEAGIRPVAEVKGLTIDLELGDVPSVQADAVQLNRALVNLVENAIHYTPSLGTITIVSQVQGDSVMIEVRDTGIGIGEEDLLHIFDRFYRADKARATETGGTGLGLAIVKSVIEMHGGTIEVESTPGEGTTFRVKLPVG